VTTQKKEETSLIIDSMKLEIPVTAPVHGALKWLLVKEGQEVSEGENLALIEA
jgi:biotin carboxyl carrier protein